MTPTQEIAHLKGQIESLCQDWVEHHTAAQKLALDMGIAPDRVEGDSYGVPGILDLLDMIRERHFATHQSAQVLQSAIMGPIQNQRPLTAEERQSLDEFTQAELESAAPSSRP
jgi:hypothetical protein